MAVLSMTGYARGDGSLGTLSWSWDVRSVNGKGLDVRCRLPAGFERLDAPARERAASLRRGNVSLNLAVAREAAGGRALVNDALLDSILSLQQRLAGRVAAEPPRLEALLGVRGLVEIVEDDEEVSTDALDDAILASLASALAALAAAREAEGERLGVVLGEQLTQVAALAREARTLAAVQPEAIRTRLDAQIAELITAQPALPEDRLMQELALLAAKADVREELDRLDAHVAAARDLFAIGEREAIGRRLEFLCQEFNREANTLCSKSADIELTRVGLALKATIDQMREQVQNVV